MTHFAHYSTLSPILIIIKHSRTTEMKNIFLPAIAHVLKSKTFDSIMVSNCWQYLLNMHVTESYES
mgnify:CR=1 FL=1